MFVRHVQVFQVLNGTADLRDEAYSGVFQENECKTVRVTIGSISLDITQRLHKGEDEN